MSAGMNNFVAHAEQQRTNSFQVSRISSHPKNELRFLSSRSGAGHLRVDKMNLSARCFGGHLFRERWINRTAIDPERVWLETIQKSVRAQGCLFDRVRMGQHCEKRLHL